MTMKYTSFISVQAQRCHHHGSAEEADQALLDCRGLTTYRRVGLRRWSNRVDRSRPGDQGCLAELSWRFCATNPTSLPMDRARSAALVRWQGCIGRTWLRTDGS